MLRKFVLQFGLAAFLCGLLLAGAPHRALAQGRGDEPTCPITMDDALTLERQQIEHLYKMRGLPLDFAKNLAADLQSRVVEYLSHLQSDEDPHARALLFYIGNAEIVCAMFWRVGEDPADTLFIMERLDAAPAAIVPMIDELVLAMQDAGDANMRKAEPRTRGVTSMAVPARPVQAVLAELSGLLFPGEIASHLGGLSSLSVVPCLNIGIVPFAALDPDGDGSALIETTAINVEAELRHVYALRAFSWNGQIGSAVVFGDPRADDDPEWFFPRLPGAEREAVTIARRLGTHAILGDAATPERFAGAILDAGYIHVAAHGFSSVEDPLDGSFLALTGGRMTARRIQELRLSEMPLVVLSACQTGLGAPLDAGVIGLARGFILAGASATAATLWNVDDAATARLMVDFTMNLETMSPGEALRRAQLSVRQMHAHPRYWSGFTLFGSRIVFRS